MRVVTDEQMREIDRIAIEERGIPSLNLMERAGEAVVDLILKRFQPNAVAICAGKGNNAGDGFVVARLLARQGVEVALYLCVSAKKLKGDSSINYCRLPHSVRKVDDPGAQKFRAEAGNADVIVDALLGTGVSGEVRGPVAEMVTAINEVRGKPVVAVDVPSGLRAESGGEPIHCVQATHTITFGLPKASMLTGPGLKAVGELTVADIGFPEDLLEVGEETSQTAIVDRGFVKSLLRPRPSDSHKGTYGHLLIIAGSAGMGGAVAMAARAAVRSGVGLVSVAVPACCLTAIETHVLSAIKRPLKSSNPDFLDGDTLAQIKRDLDQFDAVVVGPGMGRAPETQQLILTLVDQIPSPLIIDADGLNALEGKMERVTRRSAATILTPHPREMARLSGLSVSEIQRDRVQIAQRFAEEHGVTLVLKGVGSVTVGEPAIAPDVGDETPADHPFQSWVNSTGNTGLAKGGSGDVLTGLIGGLAAQGLRPTAAALVGVHWHGLAADVAARRIPEQAMTPDDVIDALGEALREILE